MANQRPLLCQDFTALSAYQHPPSFEFNEKLLKTTFLGHTIITLCVHIPSLDCILTPAGGGPHVMVLWLPSCFFSGTWCGAVCTVGCAEGEAKLAPSPGRDPGSGITLPSEAEAAAE